MLGRLVEVLGSMFRDILVYVVAVTLLFVLPYYLGDMAIAGPTAFNTEMPRLSRWIMGMIMIFGVGLLVAVIIGAIKSVYEVIKYIITGKREVDNA